MVPPLQQHGAFLECVGFGTVRQLSQIYHDLELDAVMYNRHKGELGPVPTDLQNTAMYARTLRSVGELGSRHTLVFTAKLADAHGLSTETESGVLQPASMAELLDALRPKSAMFFGTLFFHFRRAGVSPAACWTPAGSCKLVEA